tara:strand:- start:1344 stop:3572 length:2229 start_codon:yes stop_codon:yes gene_type:complete
MKKIFRFYLLIVFIFLSKTLFAKNILFEGLEKLSINDIQTLTNINLFKNNYNENEIDIITKDLFSSDLISDIKLSESQDSYIFEIFEFVLINQIYINGNINISDDIIINNISSKSNSFLLDDHVEKDIILIRNIYSNKGYNNTTVSVTSEKFSKDKINLIFSINESYPSKVKKISILGNNFFSDKYLLKKINSKNVSDFNFFSSGSNLNLDIFNFDRNILIKEYENKGFFNSRIQYELIKTDSSYSLIFYIEEGNRTKINEISYQFPGNLSINELNHLSNNFKKSFKHFDIDKINDHLQQLNDILISNDYLDLSFEANLEETDNISNLIIYTSKFNPIYVNKIQILGNEITKDETIRSKVSFESGDVIHPSQLEIARNNISNLDYIISSDISVVKNNKNDTDVIIDINENKKTGNFGFAGSYSGDTGFGLGFFLEDKNILGTGNKIDSSFNFNSEKTLFNIKYTTYPYLNNSIYNSYNIFNEEIDLTDSFGFKSTQTGFSFDQGFAYSDKIDIGWGIEYNYRKNYSSTSSSNAVNDNIGNFNSLGLKFNISYDSTNDLLYPTNGNNNNLSLFVSNADNASNSFYRFNFNNDNYYRISTENNFLFLINRAGTAQPFEGKLKTINAFSLGGLNFKGFDYRGIGPTSSSIYLGGNNYFTSTIGYGGSFLFDDTDDFKYKIFSTFGSLWGSDYTQNSNDYEIRSSVGISFDILTRLAPLSFSYAVPLQKESEDKVREFNFILGTSF